MCYVQEAYNVQDNKIAEKKKLKKKIKKSKGRGSTIGGASKAIMRLNLPS